MLTAAIGALWSSCTKRVRPFRSVYFLYAMSGTVAVCAGNGATAMRPARVPVAASTAMRTELSSFDGTRGKSVVGGHAGARMKRRRDELGLDMDKSRPRCQHRPADLSRVRDDAAYTPATALAPTNALTRPGASRRPPAGCPTAQARAEHHADALQPRRRGRPLRDRRQADLDLR